MTDKEDPCTEDSRSGKVLRTVFRTSTVPVKGTIGLVEKKSCCPNSKSQVIMSLDDTPPELAQVPKCLQATHEYDVWMKGTVPIVIHPNVIIDQIKR